MSIEFGGEDDGDQYHSIYDDFYWYTHFIDTDFAYGRAEAQTAGTAMMRLAGADLIPVDYSPQAEAIGEVRRGAGEAAEREAGRIHRTQSGAAGRRLHRDRGSAQAVGAASGRDSCRRT